MARSWYAFMGGNDPLSSSSYVKITVKHNCLCGSEICSIYAPDNGFNPSDPLSPRLQRYIIDALVTGQLQPSDPYDAKKFVYLR